MYINNVSLWIYILISIFGIVIGQFIDYCIIKLPQHKKIFSKDLKEYIKKIRPNYITICLVTFIYLSTLYMFGIHSIKTLQYLVLTPMLIIAFSIDYKLEIIPNRLTLLIFETGLLFTFIQGISNINIAIEMLLGMFVGAGIFLTLTLVGGLIFGKETIGFGDVKIMGALGLFFGWRSIIIISILAFFIAAIFSIILLIYLSIKKKEKVEFIAFGPFIVVATFIVMFIPFEILVAIPFEIFTLGKYKR